jgi:hypothetical protein
MSVTPAGCQRERRQANGRRRLTHITANLETLVRTGSNDVAAFAPPAAVGGLTVSHLLADVPVGLNYDAEVPDRPVTDKGWGGDMTTWTGPSARKRKRLGTFAAGLPGRDPCRAGPQKKITAPRCLQTCTTRADAAQDLGVGGVLNVGSPSVGAVGAAANRRLSRSGSLCGFTSHEGCLACWRKPEAGGWSCAPKPQRRARLLLSRWLRRAARS